MYGPAGRAGGIVHCTIHPLPLAHRTVENHRLGKMLDARLSATLCTDNRLISHTSVSREIRLAVDAFDIDLDQLRHTIIYGFKRSFYPGTYTEKRAYVRQVIDYYQKVVDELVVAPD